MFLFGDAEWTGVREYCTSVNTVPIPRELGGVFSANIFDPVTCGAATCARQQFLNNTIPASRIDPVAARVGLTRNFTYNAPRTSDLNRWDARYDYALNERPTTTSASAANARSPNAFPTSPTAQAGS